MPICPHQSSIRYRTLHNLPSFAFESGTTYSTSTYILRCFEGTHSFHLQVFGGPLTVTKTSLIALGPTFNWQLNSTSQKNKVHKNNIAETWNLTTQTFIRSRIYSRNFENIFSVADTDGSMDQYSKDQGFNVVLLQNPHSDTKHGEYTTFFLYSDSFRTTKRSNCKTFSH